MSIKKLHFLPLFTVIVLFLFACVDEKSKTKPVPGGTVNIRLEGAPTIINHYIRSSYYSSHVANMVFQPLATFDPKTLELQPLLIRDIPKSRTVTDGPHKGQQAFDFEILDGAQWDNGSPVTGYDYLFTVKAFHVPQVPADRWRVYWQGLSDIEVDPANPRKFTVYWKEYYMLTLETLCQTPLLPAYHYDPGNRLKEVRLVDLLDPAKAAQLAEDANLKAYGEEFQQPARLVEPAGISGSGPYRIESLDANSGAILVKKANWWGDAYADTYPLLGAYPERLVYKVVKDDVLLTNMLQNGEIDVAGNVNAAKFNEYRQDTFLSKQYQFQTQGDNVYTFWQFNLTNPKLRELAVRQALSHIVDYDYIINTIQQGMAARMVSPILPSTSYYARDLTLPDFNIEKAKKLLADAGWVDTDGNGIVDKVIDGKKTDLTIEVMGAQTRSTELTLASLVQTGRLAGVGITTSVSDLTELTKLTKDGKFETALMSRLMAPTWIDLYQEWHSASLAPAGDNRSRFADAVVDSLIVAVRSTPDEQKRKEFYHDLQKRMHEQVPSVFLFAPLQRVAVSRKFEPVFSANRPGFYEQLFQRKQ